MRILRVLGSLVLIGLLAVGAGAWWLRAEVGEFLIATPSSAHEERILEIPRGAGPQRVASLLAAAGVVTDAERFALYLRYTKSASGLRTGEFRFWTDQTPAQVVDLLLHAPEVMYSVTLPEGLRIEELAALVESAGMGSAAEYARRARDKDVIAAYALPFGAPPPTLEGLLVPETYSFRRGATEVSVMDAQIAALLGIWDDRRSQRAREIGLSPYQVMTLASVVEKETGVVRERPLIAGVFHNRLRLGMRLESDPTIIYGLKNYDGNIRQGDIRRPHPWNTYVIAGLPPTPIAAPGLAAIDGVLWPDATEALFFVARGDGSHHFSVTYAEHARMVRRFQLGQ